MKNQKPTRPKKKKINYNDIYDTISVRQIIFISIIGISVFLFAYYRPSLINRKKEENLGVNVSTTAKVIDIKENYSMTQGKTGNHLNVNFYVITYKYYVNGTEYIATDKLENGGSNGQLIKQITSDINAPIQILYNFDSPKKSLIKTD